MAFETVRIKNHFEKTRHGLVVNGLTVNGKFQPIETPLELPTTLEEEQDHGVQIPDRSNVLLLPILGGETVQPKGDDDKPLEVPRMDFSGKGAEVAYQEEGDLLPLPSMNWTEHEK